MNWIRKEKRLAIYLRDGLACCYCGQGVEDDAKLTLDHLTPHSRGGSNQPDNLVTCCHACNSLRRNHTVNKFVKTVLRHSKPDKVLRHIFVTTRRVVDVEAAKTLIARRGGFTKALYN